MPPHRSLVLRFLLVAGTAVLSGCGAAGPEDAGGPVGVAAQPIMGGKDDAADRAVVEVIRTASNGTYSACSGALIAPNVVLTAHHCVADVQNVVVGIDCKSPSFAAPDAPGNLWVATQETPSMPAGPGLAPAGFHAVREVAVPAESTDTSFCGLDQAILVLVASVPASEAVPLVPRVDSEITAGEGYSAVGFGLTSDGASDSGTRRRLDGLHVACVGMGCSALAGGNLDTTREWGGGDAPCEGDSGGPALDAQNRVTGVASRALLGCKAPIYGDVFAWAGWIKQTAAHAATEGGYAAPPWVTASTSSSTSSGCSVPGSGRSAAPAPWLLCAALGALARLRRRR